MDTVTMQIIESGLEYACEEMGIALRNSAYSPNIKERMDHSAAVFDSRGRMLAQAEHIPVHLGSLPWGLRNMLEVCAREGPELSPGSMVMANDPYVTGTHLNDVTVVAPVHLGDELVAFAVNKAHHSDVGGKVPGSISMEAETLAEEGFVMEPTRLMERGRFCRTAVSRFASSSRTPNERLGDIRAQAAANLCGSRRISELLEKYGLSAFRSAADRTIEHSRRMVKKRLAGFPTGVREAEDWLEGRNRLLKLHARLEVSRDGVLVDYEGTDGQLDYPLNAVLGVTLSGVFFVVRTLTGDDIPANDGAFAPVRVRAPSGSLLNPEFPHPVGGGNVETSQRNADVVFKAFSKLVPGRVPAASGGSMNNVMLGGTSHGRRWAFYETIGVGLGGRPGLDGIDGIQCNMTNTMNTPIEEIERTMPIVLTRYGFRAGSSGAGRYRGGVGIVRAYEAAADGVTFTVLGDRSKVAPWGLRGGKEGSKTSVMVSRGGTARRASAKATYLLKRGDAVEIRTAGGGGFGDPGRRPRVDVEKDVRNGILSAARAKDDYPSFRSGGVGEI